MQQQEDTIKQQQNEIEDLKRKLRLKDEAEAKVHPRSCPAANVQQAFFVFLFLGS